jgi:MFS transporter, DHA1 family, multidrug resistance protein
MESRCRCPPIPGNHDWSSLWQCDYHVSLKSRPFSSFLTEPSIVTKTRFARKMKKHGRVIPEERLPPMILGSIILPIGLFWFAWTSSPHITWVPQVIAGVPIGWGILMIFLQGLNYIIDVYMWHANSAIAANTLLRSLAGAGFPLFARAMYLNLGVNWATSLLGFLCIAMIPAPILFYIYGAKIRKMSKFSPSA